MATAVSIWVWVYRLSWVENNQIIIRFIDKGLIRICGVNPSFFVLLAIFVKIIVV